MDAHQTTTGPEICLQLETAGLQPDAFVAGVGTGGTVMGVGQFLRGRNAKIKVHPVEPAESPTLSTGHKVGKHRIQGISDEFIPALVNLAALDEVFDDELGGVDAGEPLGPGALAAERRILAVGVDRKSVV